MIFIYPQTTKIGIKKGLPISEKPAKFEGVGASSRKSPSVMNEILSTTLYLLLSNSIFPYKIRLFQHFASYLVLSLFRDCRQNCRQLCRQFRPHTPPSTPHFSSNPLSQIVTSNPRLQPDTHFAVDMFPYKKTELFSEVRLYIPTSEKARKYAAFWHLFIFS